MNGVLLIACVGPMQSWGTRSRFQERDTEREPSKSGIVGMLCAALGRDREEPIEDLAGLTMGVRVDREGIIAKDFQTAQDVAIASGGSPKCLISNRYFLADATFLVGLEGEMLLLEKLHAALANPKWPIFLGRKSYVSSAPSCLTDGLVENGNLRNALTEYPLLISDNETDFRKRKVKEGKDDGRVRLVLESATPTHEARRDHPVSYSLGRRMFRERFVVTEYLDLDSCGGKGDD
jgi:CRISPR system Cascade subunit CasD